jgi:hypothetical protein
MGGLNNPSPQVVPNTPTIPGLLAKYFSRTPGEYYGLLGAGYAVGVTTSVADKLYSMPFLVLKTETFDRIAIMVDTAAAGNARLGIYGDNNFAPGALVLDAGEVDTSTAGTKSITINQSLNPGLYWLTAIYNATPKVYAPLNVVNFLGIGSSSFITGQGNGNMYYTDQVYGELPANHPTPTIGTVNCHSITLRRA